MPEQANPDGNDEPLNEVERKLHALMLNEISTEDFLETFLQGNFYIMVNGEPQGGVLGDKVPMVVASSEKDPHLLAIFSSPVRAKRMIERFADYSYPILVNADWVFEHLGPTMGITFNPGCTEGFELQPEGAQQLKAAIVQARAQAAE